MPLAFLTNSLQFNLIESMFYSFFHFQLVRGVPDFGMAANVNNNSIQETKEIQIQKNPKNLQTLYQYFEGDGINSGLRAEERDWFELNGKKFRIFSGSLHYFRVHPAYWRDRLRKFRAAGLNAIDV